MKLLPLSVVLITIILSFTPAQVRAELHNVLNINSQIPDSANNATYFLNVPKDQALNIDAIRSLPLSDWQPPQNKVLNFGYSEDTYWFKLNIQAKDAQSVGRYYYKIDYPVLDYIGFYLEQDEQIIEQHFTGDAFPFSQRPFESQSFVLPLDLEKNEIQTLYIELRSEGTLQLPAKLLSEADYNSSTMAFYIIHGIYFGVVGIMMFYNLVLFFAFWAREFLYYVLYAGMMMLVLSTLHGFNYQYLWPDAIWWNSKAIPIAISAGSFAFLLFTYHFLNIRNYSIRLANTNRVLTAIMGLTAALSFSLPYSMAIKLAAVTSIISIFLCVMTSYKAFKFNEPAAKQYMLAWFVMLFGAFCFLLAMFGVLPSNALTQNTLQIGLAFEVIILSFALAEKIRQVREASDRNQKKRLVMQYVAKEQEEALSLQQSHADELEIQVQERTTELQLALSELSGANHQLQQMCTIDGLTQIHNRRFFDEQLAVEWRCAMREKTALSIIIMDIDHFKSLNDNYGHLVGDECLKLVAQKISSHCRRPADRAARYGGEEFVMILPNTSMDDALTIAKDIRCSIQSHMFKRDNIQITITVSIGVSTSNKLKGKSLSPSGLVHAADQAMYRAKEGGRNKVECASLSTNQA